MPDIQEEKKFLRSKIKEILSSITKEKRLNLSIQWREQFRKLFKTLANSEDFIWGVYAPLSDEVWWPDPEIKLRTAFPRLTGKREMEFVECGYHELTSSREFGTSILVPPQEKLGVCPSILLIPGLAFDKKGVRLGRGKGFYDRYLEHFKGQKIGVAWECQLLASVPSDVFDQQMDYVVTEQRIIKVS